MKLIGKVQRTSRKGDLIARADASVKEGTKVWDPVGNAVGSVSRILGPVEKPYIVVKPNKNVNSSRLRGIQLYCKKEGAKCQKAKGRRKR